MLLYNNMVLIYYILFSLFINFIIEVLIPCIREARLKKQRKKQKEVRGKLEKMQGHLQDAVRMNMKYMLKVTNSMSYAHFFDKYITETQFFFNEV